MQLATFSLWRLHSSFAAKGVSVLLAVSFVCAPLAAYAQQTSSDTPAVNTGAGTGTPDTVTSPTATPATDQSASPFSIPGVDSGTQTPAPTDATAPTDTTQPQ